MKPTVKPRHCPPASLSRRLCLPLVALAAAVTMGCGGSSSPPPPAGSAQRPADGGTAALKFFDGEAACARLEAHIEDSLIASLAEQLERQRASGWTEDVAFAPPPPVAAPAPETTGSTFSSTTLRTAGIDEADPVKNDGRRILTLKVMRDATVLSRVDLAGAGQMALTAQARWPHAEPDAAERIDGLYLLDGDRAMALTTSGDSPHGAMPAPGLLTTPMPPDANADRPAITRLRLVDLTSPTLATRWETTVAGALLGSRRIGDRLYLVTRASPVLPAGVAPWVSVPDGERSRFDAAIDAQLETNRRLIRQVDLRTWLAPISQQGEPGAGDCATYARVDAPSQLGFVRVTSIDLGSRAVSSQTVLGEASGLYQSGRSLILLSADWDREGNQTHLHRFTTDDAGVPSYEGSGTIEGHLINQYAIDETDDGIVRVAVRGRGHTYLATLQPATAPSAWRELGRSGQIARGETLQSARFVGDRAYLVTFLQVDPFFVYDLSDPRRPTELGELKIPGFSTWLHPVGPNHVLGVGHGEGSPREIKASLFDVTDPAAPREQSTLLLGRSYTASDALWDPHAFTWYAPATPVAGLPSAADGGTFAVPVRSYAWPPGGIGDESGVRIVSVRPAAGAAALSLNGSISLTDRLTVGDASVWSGWSGWRAADARRAVFVDATVYAIADGAIRSASIAAPATSIATVDLP